LCECSCRFLFLSTVHMYHTFAKSPTLGVPRLLPIFSPLFDRESPFAFPNNAFSAPEYQMSTPFPLVPVYPVSLVCSKQRHICFRYFFYTYPLSPLQLFAVDMIFSFPSCHGTYPLPPINFLCPQRGFLLRAEVVLCGGGIPPSTLEKCKNSTSAV